MWPDSLRGGCFCGFATVCAGTLEASASLVPIAHIWTRSAQPWIAIPADALRYEQQPADMLELVRACQVRSR
jgi:hypothetical protein